MKYLWFFFGALLLVLFAHYLYRTSFAPGGSSFGGVSLSLEYATTTAAQQLGLGGRTHLPPSAGMLFVFSKSDYYGFWMKDTLIPLDMFWLDDSRRVIWMEQGVATDTYPTVFYPPAPARYVLETNAGFAAAHAIATGTQLQLR